MDEFDLGINWEYLRRVTLNQGYTLNTYINSMADQLYPNVLKTTLLNLGYEAFYNGTRTIREMRKIHNCNIPWIILMDPTSACNLHCTGCWAAEYGNKLNLTAQFLIHKSTIGICQKNTVIMLFAESNHVFFTYKRLSACKHIKINPQFFSLDYLNGSYKCL